VEYRLGESATAFAADHFGPAIAAALNHLRLNNSIRTLYIREGGIPAEKVSREPTTECTADYEFDAAVAHWRSAVCAQAAFAAEARDGKPRVLPSQRFLLTSIVPQAGMAITRSTTIRFATEPASKRFTFAVSISLGTGTFESLDVYRCVKQLKSSIYP
jgi:hypothetical protein